MNEINELKKTITTKDGRDWFEKQAKELLRGNTDSIEMSLAELANHIYPITHDTAYSKVNIEISSEKLESKSHSMRRKQLKELHGKTGIYFLILKNICVYIGSTSNLANRLSNHIKAKPFNRVEFIEYEDVNKMKRDEITHIKENQPLLNSMHSIDKAIANDNVCDIVGVDESDFVCFDSIKINKQEDAKKEIPSKHKQKPRVSLNTLEDLEKMKECIVLYCDLNMQFRQGSCVAIANFPNRQIIEGGNTEFYAVRRLFFIFIKEVFQLGHLNEMAKDDSFMRLGRGVIKNRLKDM